MELNVCSLVNPFKKRQTKYRLPKDREKIYLSRSVSKLIVTHFLLYMKSLTLLRQSVHQDSDVTPVTRKNYSTSQLMLTHSILPLTSLTS